MGNTMKKMRGALTALFAAMLALAMAIAPGAALAGTTTTADVTITGVEPGATVSVYQVVKYTDGSGYEWTITPSDDLPDLSATTITTPTHETWDKIIDRAETTTVDNQPTSQTAGAAAEGETYTSVKFEDLPRGMYVVKVTNPDNSTYVYLNTVFTVDAKNDDGTLKDQEIALKGNHVITTKEVDKSSIAVGETATFTITSTVPHYDQNPAATERTYQIVDTLDTGLSFAGVESVVATGGSNDPLTLTKVDSNPGNEEYTVTQDGQKITINLDNAIVHLDGEGYTKITVKLKATRLAGSTPELWNHVFTNFSTDSHSTTTGKTPEPEVPVVDFKINLYKTGAGSALSGAKFTLTKVVDGTTYYVQEDGSLSTTEYEFVTGSDGYIKFVGLSEGTYTLTETYAPDGYYISQPTRTLEVKGTYKDVTVTVPYTTTTDDGTGNVTTSTENVSYTYKQLTGYTLTVTTGTGDDATSTDITGAVDISNGKVTNATAELTVDNPAQGLLPHTGEAGTIALTVCGVGLVIIASSWAVRNRKKATK